MNVSTTTRRCALGVLTVWMLSCSSTSKMPAPIPEPSVIDPKSPPKIRLDGLNEGDFLPEKKPLKIRYKVENFPISENYQKIVFRLNNASPVILEKGSGEVTLTEGLMKGSNVLRVYLMRSWGESLKTPDSNRVVSFFYADRVGISPLSESLPVLTLVSPRGKFFGELGKKILFDLLLQGKALPKSKMKVRYSLNGVFRELPLGKAVYFEHLPQGKYILKVDLTDKSAIRGSIDLAHEESVFEVLERLPE